MSAYLVQFDLTTLSERLSRALGCQLSVGELRELLRDVGFVESANGWLTTDPRMLMLALVPPGKALFRLATPALACCPQG